MVDVFVHRADVHSPNGAGLDLKNQREEMAQLVKRDIEGKGLFDGIFKPKPPRHAFVDLEDEGVQRCPRCLWEVHHGFCENPQCGMRIQTGEFSDEDSEGEMIYDGVDRWAESALDTDNLTAGEEDEWEDEIDDDGLTDGDERHLHQEYDSDDEPIQSSRRRRRAIASEESDEESDTGTEGSLADFVEHDTPGHYGIGPRPGGYIPDSTFMASSSPTSEQSQPTRRNIITRGRPIVIDDDDDDDDPSSMSETSMSRAGFRPARHVSLSSDYEDEEGSPLMQDGYQSLGNATASENEDEVVYQPRRRRNLANTIPEEETESEDMSEDTDGDIHMEEMPRPRNGRVNGTRSYGNNGRQVIDLDSASESEAALSPDRRGGRRGPQNGIRTDYFTAHQRNSNGPSNRTNRGRPLSALVDPSLASLFQSHSNRLQEHALNSLARGRNSVSPARSITPVQRDITGDRRRPSRDTTPTVSANNNNNIPPLFSSPLEPSRAQPSHTPITISSTITTPATHPAAPGPPQSSPLSSASPTGIPASLQARLASLTGSPQLGTRNPFGRVYAQQLNGVPRISSPGLPRISSPNAPRLSSPGVPRISSPGIRVRPRSSRTQLRSSNSRTILRTSTASPPMQPSAFHPPSIAGTMANRPPPPVPAPHTRPGAGPRQYTPEYIRALGLQARQNPNGQQQPQARIQAQPGLTRPLVRRDVSSTSSGQREAPSLSRESTVTLSPGPPGSQSQVQQQQERRLTGAVNGQVNSGTYGQPHMNGNRNGNNFGAQAT